MKRALSAALAVFILTLVLAAFWMGGIIMGESATNVSTQNGVVDYVVILGCRLEGEAPGRCLKARIDAAVDYLRRRPTAMAVCAGGQGDDEVISEAEAISRELQRRGIPARRILKEDQSRTTYENLANTKALLDARRGGGAYRIAVATNDFHIYRARRLAAYVGFENPAALSAPTPALEFYPCLIREICAVTVSWLRFR